MQYILQYSWGAHRCGPCAGFVRSLAAVPPMAVNILLRLSSRGEALVAELLRVSDHIPALFSLADRMEQKAFGDVLLDFAFLKTPALFEHKIENSAELVVRDNEIWEAHGPIICRVFDLFESIYKYIKDFVKYVNDLRDGVYLQQTIEGVLLDDEGKQLMCEALYLYGVLLLLMDAKIDGPVRERIVIAYYRHRGQSSIESIEDMELLVRRTGYSLTTLDRNGLVRRPPGYPEEYLNRLVRKLGLPPALVLMMIDRLRSEDMYSQIPSYPMPQHRSTALATQVSQWCCPARCPGHSAPRVLASAPVLTSAPVLASVPALCARAATAATGGDPHAAAAPLPSIAGAHAVRAAVLCTRCPGGAAPHHAGDRRPPLCWCRRLLDRAILHGALFTPRPSHPARCTPPVVPRPSRHACRMHDRRAFWRSSPTHGSRTKLPRPRCPTRPIQPRSSASTRHTWHSSGRCASSWRTT